jgi:hypothetical protein
MSTGIAGTLAIRGLSGSPTHHLWNNNGTWWCHYTVHLPDSTKKRIRVSLHTGNFTKATRLRDSILNRRIVNPDQECGTMAEGAATFPHHLVEHYYTYTVHKIAFIQIINDVIRFTFINHDGKLYRGNGADYCGIVNGRKPVWKEMLVKSGLERVEDIRFVITFVGGAIPFGHPLQLLKEYPSKYSDDLKTRILKSMAKSKWQRTSSLENYKSLKELRCQNA